MATTCNQRTVEAPSAMFSTDRIAVTGLPVCAASADPFRRSVLVRADPDNTIDLYVLSSGSQSRTQGFRLTPGGGITLSTAAPVYVVCGIDGGSGVAYVVTETGEVG